MKTLLEQPARFALIGVLGAALAATALPGAGRAQAPGARDGQGATAGEPAGNNWTKVKLLYTNAPPPEDRWVADLLKKHGNKPDPYGSPKGTPVTYQVFEVVPNSRTIVAIGFGPECEAAPNHAASKLTGTQCPMYTITQYANGAVNARSTRPACYLWVGPKTTAEFPDPRTNATYMRLDRQTSSIQVVTVVDGQPQSGCSNTTHP